ncbi:MAG: hypothetical protein JWP52_2745 [Rhizobacter sp.]|nr:hypothetical protein [Rhizobacter sp.]
MSFVAKLTNLASRPLNGGTLQQTENTPSNVQGHAGQLVDRPLHIPKHLNTAFIKNDEPDSPLKHLSKSFSYLKAKQSFALNRHERLAVHSLAELRELAAAMASWLAEGPAGTTTLVLGEAHHTQATTAALQGCLPLMKEMGITELLYERTPKALQRDFERCMTVMPLLEESKGVFGPDFQEQAVQLLERHLADKAASKGQEVDPDALRKLAHEELQRCFPVLMALNQGFTVTPIDMEHNPENPGARTMKAREEHMGREVQKALLRQEQTTGRKVGAVILCGAYHAPHLAQFNEDGNQAVFCFDYESEGSADVMNRFHKNGFFDKPQCLSVRVPEEVARSNPFKRPKAPHPPVNTAGFMREAK